MPKNTHAHGPSYDGHVDTAPHKSQPEWAEQLAVIASYLEDELPEPKEDAKPKRKASTTAKAGAAKGTGATRG